MVANCYVSDTIVMPLCLSNAQLSVRILAVDVEPSACDIGVSYLGHCTLGADFKRKFIKELLHKYGVRQFLGLCYLGCDVVWSGGNLPASRGNLLFPSLE
jgi:hypothetical protein